jgi:hypothetical protein
MTEELQLDVVVTGTDVQSPRQLFERNHDRTSRYPSVEFYGLFADVFSVHAFVTVSSK